MAQISPARHLAAAARSRRCNFNVTPQWSCHGFDTRKDERPPFLRRATEGSAKWYLAIGDKSPSPPSENSSALTYT